MTSYQGNNVSTESETDPDSGWIHLDIVPEIVDGLIHWDLPQPWSVDYIQPQLKVFRTGLQPITIKYDTTPDIAVDQLKGSGFLSNNRIIFVAHGFKNSIDTEWMTRIKDQLIQESDQTVALVGWGRGADLLPIRYRQSAANVQSVGVWLAGYAQQINHSVAGIEIWGIGHSLGAHLLGIAGRNSYCFNRITGLDPAGPAFEKMHDSKSLRKTDAAFVDVIHTDGYDPWIDPRDWLSPVNHYGSLLPMGNIDFYPNYGYHQPGAGGFHIAGSHLRAIELFIWSIGNPGQFRTYDLLDGSPEFEKPVKKLKRDIKCIEMGFHCYFGNNTNGCYYLETNSAEPWVPITKQDSK